MKIQEALSILNSKFVYKSDKKYFDKWKILTGEEKWEGDCEDYALTLMWLLSDRNILKFLWNIMTFEFLMWYVKLPSGEGHAIVKFKDLYYDNVQKKGVTFNYLKHIQGYKFKFPMLFPFVYFKLLISYSIGFMFK